MMNAAYASLLRSAMPQRLQSETFGVPDKGVEASGFLKCEALCRPHHAHSILELDFQAAGKVPSFEIGCRALATVPLPSLAAFHSTRLFPK